MKEAQTLACQRQDLTQKLSTLTPGYHDMTLFCDTGNLWNVNIRKSVLPTVIVLLEYRKNHIKSLSLNHCNHCVLTIIWNCLISNNTQGMWSCFSCFNSLRLKYFLNIVGVGGCVLWFYSSCVIQANQWCKRTWNNPVVIKCQHHVSDTEMSGCTYSCVTSALCPLLDQLWLISGQNPAGSLSPPPLTRGGPNRGRERV